MSASVCARARVRLYFSFVFFRFSFITSTDELNTTYVVLLSLSVQIR